MLVACAGSSCVEVRRLSRGLQDLLRPPRQRAALELLALVGADRGYHLVSHERREKPPRSLLLMIPPVHLHAGGSDMDPYFAQNIIDPKERLT